MQIIDLSANWHDAQLDAYIRMTDIPCETLHETLHPDPITLDEEDHYLFVAWARQSVPAR